MMDPSSRPARKVAIADHIWQAFEEMSAQMGSDRDALINQAMFMFARLNGFLETAAPASGGRGHGDAVAASSQSIQGRGAGAQSRALRSGAMSAEASAGAMDDDPVRREVQERVLETAAELERLIKAKGQAGGQSQSGGAGPDDGAGGAGAGSDARAGAAGGLALYMAQEGGQQERISKDRYIIGRGKHCDFVINSGKVSREHAVVLRESGQYFLEDLGSSNGTWFNKQRIKRRKIEEGDEYFICSEKVRFTFR